MHRPGTFWILPHYCDKDDASGKMKNINVVTTGGGANAWGIGTIDLSEGDGETISIDALMVHRNPLGFELLIGIDTIKA